MWAVEVQVLGGLAALTELEILGPVHLHDDSVRALSMSSALRALRLVRSPCDHERSQVSLNLVRTFIEWLVARQRPVAQSAPPCRGN